MAQAESDSTTLPTPIPTSLNVTARRRQACFASYGPTQNSGFMGIDVGRAKDARSRTTTIRAATTTTTLSVFALRTSFHAQSISLRWSAIGVRTGSSVLIGMANAPESGMLRYLCLEKMPADGTVAARFYADSRHVQLQAVKKV